MKNLLLLRDEHELRKVIGSIANDKIDKYVVDADRESQAPQQVFDALNDIGLFRSFDSAGEINSDTLELLVRNSIIAAEELSAACAGLATLFTVHSMSLLPVLLYGSNNGTYKPGGELLSGSRLFGYLPADGCYSPDADGGGLSYSASDGSEENYLINGTIANALPGYTGQEGSYVLVTAFRDTNGTSDAAEQTEPDSENLVQTPRICSSFLIESTQKGVRTGEKEKTLGLSAAPLQSLVFDDCVVPKNSIIGSEGDGETISKYIETIGRFFVTAQAIGVIRKSYQIARAYSLKREQFGKKIGTFQAIEDMLVNIRIKLKASSDMLYSSLTAVHENIDKAYVLSAQVKLFATDEAVSASTDAVQIYGGYGYMRDFPTEKLMRDAKMLQVIYGNPHHLKRLLAGRL